MSKKLRTKKEIVEPLPKSLGLLHWIVLLAVGVTPVLLSTSFPEIFEFPKIVFVYFLAIVVLATVLWWWYERGKVVLVYSWLLIPVAIFLVLMGLATVLSIDPYTSLVGYYSRFNGGLLSYVACAILLYATVVDVAAVHPGDNQRAKRLRQIIWVWVGSATAVALLAVPYHYGHDPLCLFINGTFDRSCWGLAASPRPFVTLGQTNLLASYLVSAMPLALFLLLTTVKRAYRWLLLGSASVIFLVLLYTLSRSGWLGLVAGLAVLAVFVPWRSLKLRFGWLVGLAAIWAFLLVINFASFNQRVVETVSETEQASPASTANTRSLVWQAVWQVVVHHPWVGTGPETFAYSYLPYRPPELNTTAEWNTLYDKAHNELLQLASGAGIPAMVAWLTVFVAPVVLVFKRWRELWSGSWFRRGVLPIGRRVGLKVEQDEVEAIAKTPEESSGAPLILVGAMLASSWGVIVTLMFGFSTITVAVVLFVSLALLVAPTVGLREWSISEVAKRGLLAIMTVVVIIFGYMWWRYVVADWRIQAAQNAGGQGNVAKMVADFKQAVERNPYERFYRLAWSYSLALQGTQQQDKAREALYAQAAKEADEALNQGVLGEAVLTRAVNTYTYLAEQDEHYVPVLGRLLERGAKLMPGSANMTRYMANYYMVYDKKDEAKAAYDRLVEYRPTADSFLQRAGWYEKYGDETLERQDLDRAVELSRNGVNAPVYKKATERLAVLDAGD